MLKAIQRKKPSTCKLLYKRKRERDKKQKDSVELDPSIWGELPLEIQLTLLYYLPIPALCRFRAVSESWYEGCSRAMEQRRSQGKCYVLALCNKEPVIYSKQDQAWFQPLWNCEPRNSFIVSSKGKLTCFSAINGLWVTVMAQGRVIHLPNRPCHHRLMFAGMDILDDSSYVIVFVDGEGGDELVRGVQVYHSITGRWVNKPLEIRKGERFMRGLNETSSRCAALRGSTLFFLTEEANLLDLTLYSMDVLTGVITCPSQLYRLQVNLLECGAPRLVVCAGKLLMVHMQNTGIGKGKPRWTIGIQEFKEEEKEWSCVSMLPLHLLPRKSRDMRFLPLGHVSSGNGGDICISFTTDTPSYAYDMCADKWEILPGGIYVYAAYPFELSAL